MSNSRGSRATGKRRRSRDTSGSPFGSESGKAMCRARRGADPGSSGALQQRWQPAADRVPSALPVRPSPAGLGAHSGGLYDHGLCAAPAAEEMSLPLSHTP